eukprot:scaffold6103_cov18-Tisochrysis_lutea.AAC.1
MDASTGEKLPPPQGLDPGSTSISGICPGRHCLLYHAESSKFWELWSRWLSAATLKRKNNDWALFYAIGLPGQTRPLKKLKGSLVTSDVC